ncbi:MAG TPA: NUDIX domain-containing protein [Nocardioidaceae bacterium]|nr:NUDIX domain-containing protein [Nocardioidaceae bacterium]
MVLVMGAAIVRAGRVLAARRTLPTGLAGGWEFPGGKVEPGELPEQALVREIAEELGCRVEVTGHLSKEVPIRDGYTLRVAVASLVEGEPVPREDEHDAVRWLGPEELDAVTWLEPDVPFLDELRELLLDGERLEGGNVGVTVRIGATVRRATGPWTPAVHALLDHLADEGMPGVPRVLGTDSRGREILEYLPGTIVDVDRDVLGEARLESIVAWTRLLHDTVAGFDHQGPWRHPAVDHPEVVAHNDIAPYNVCFAGDRVAGVFDWDLAAPSTRLMELGLLAWTCVPLFRPTDPTAVARRLELIARTYGRYTAREILDAAEARVRFSSEAVRHWITTGAPGADGMLAVGEPERTEDALADWARRRPAIEEALS